MPLIVFFKQLISIISRNYKFILSTKIIRDKVYYTFISLIMGVFLSIIFKKYKPFGRLENG